MNCNILLVDDDEILLETYKAILESEGFTLFTAKNPYEALHTIKKKEIHLAILDYNLPYMNGTQLGHLIDKYKENIKIMFISGNSKIHEYVLDASFPVYEVLSKPIDVPYLINRVKEITSNECTPKLHLKPKTKESEIKKRIDISTTKIKSIGVDFLKGINYLSISTEIL